MTPVACHRPPPSVTAPLMRAACPMILTARLYASRSHVRSPHKTRPGRPSASTGYSRAAAADSGDEIASVVTALSDLLTVPRRADPADKGRDLHQIGRASC